MRPTALFQSDALKRINGIHFNCVDNKRELSAERGEPNEY